MTEDLQQDHDVRIGPIPITTAASRLRQSIPPAPPIFMLMNAILNRRPQAHHDTACAR
ncbi:hypothetical protein CSIRO_1078 [Bradyrhizobiaceae bacterium SG-6C]|nr:hypothetical protein CSIRO_1078 [Bradyrhizobiaceae bacterium SG-6C]